MNPEAIAKLKEITSKDISSLSEPDKLFLRARRSYLTKSELEYYAEVLEPAKKAEKDKAVVPDKKK